MLIQTNYQFPFLCQTEKNQYRQEMQVRGNTVIFSSDILFIGQISYLIITISYMLYKISNMSIKISYIPYKMSFMPIKISNIAYKIYILY